MWRSLWLPLCACVAVDGTALRGRAGCDQLAVAVIELGSVKGSENELDAYCRRCLPTAAAHCSTLVSTLRTAQQGVDERFLRPALGDACERKVAALAPRSEPSGFWSTLGRVILGTAQSTPKAPPPQAVHAHVSTTLQAPDWQQLLHRRDEIMSGAAPALPAALSPSAHALVAGTSPGNPTWSDQSPASPTTPSSAPPKDNAAATPAASAALTSAAPTSAAPATAVAAVADQPPTPQALVSHETKARGAASARKAQKQQQTPKVRPAPRGYAAQLMATARSTLDFLCNYHCGLAEAPVLRISHRAVEDA